MILGSSKVAASHELRVKLNSVMFSETGDSDGYIRFDLGDAFTSSSSDIISASINGSSVINDTTYSNGEIEIDSVDFTAADTYDVKVNAVTNNIYAWNPGAVTVTAENASGTPIRTYAPDVELDLIDVTIVNVSKSTVSTGS